MLELFPWLEINKAQYSFITLPWLLLTLATREVAALTFFRNVPCSEWSAGRRPHCTRQPKQHLNGRRG